MNTCSKHLVRAALGGALLLVPQLALAGFTNPHVPDFRGAPGTEYGAWESFTFPHGGQNLPDLPNATTVDAALEQLDTTAFLTSGNIYSFQAPIRCVLSDTVPEDLQELALQISTKGSEPDYAGVRLEYVDGQGQVQSLPWTSYTQLAYIPSMGVDVESLFEWDLSSLGDDVLAYTLVFEAQGPHMSLDALVLDTRFGEPDAAAYCTAKTTSSGCTPAIGWTGTPSASGAFIVSAAFVQPNQLGVLFYAQNGPAALPFQGGFLCVAPPVKRLAVQGSGGSGPCSGAYAADFSAHYASGLDAGLVPGAQVWAQFWFRDPGAASGTGLTDALVFTLQ